MQELDWYSWIVIYVVGYMVCAFVFRLLDIFYEDGEVMVPMFWPISLPIFLLVVFFIAIHIGSTALADHCKKCMRRWGG